MSALHPRTKMVYFRISEEEHVQFSRYCEQSGARSLSDLARFAVQRVLEEREGPESLLQRRVEDLNAAVGGVQEQLVELTAYVKAQAKANQE